MERIVELLPELTVALGQTLLMIAVAIPAAVALGIPLGPGAPMGYQV